MVRSSRRVLRRLAALALVVVSMAMLAPAAMAQTSVVTQEDCDRGNIQRNGRTLSREECERLIGQRVNAASTGFEAWIVGGLGVMLLAGSAGIYMRRRGMGAHPA